MQRTGLLLFSAACLWVGTFASLAHSATLKPTEFRIPIPGGGGITGQVDYPETLTHCVAGGVRYPVLMMVPGSGAFDRDVSFGASASPAASPKNLLFKELSYDVTRKEVIVVRFDYRGVSHGGAIDLPTRAQVTPETTQADIARVFTYSRGIPCADSERVAVFAHSEGTIHVAKLVSERKILPNALVFLGMVASSASSIVRWQAVERTLQRIERELKSTDRFPNEGLKRLGFTEGLTDKGYWTREEALIALGKSYERIKASELAKPDSEMKSGFWSYRYWKMWWRDEFSPLEALKSYPYGIYAHFADQDDSTPGEREMALFEKARPSFSIRPKLVMHKGVGHSLGEDRLKGPMLEEPRKKLVEDLVLAARAEPESRVDWGKVPYFGVVFAASPPLPPSVRKQAGVREEYGLRLERVIPSLPAWNAGLRIGDIILAFNGEEVGLLPKDDAAARLSRRARSSRPGTKARFQVLRWDDRFETKPAMPVDSTSQPSSDQMAKWIDERLESHPGLRHELRFTRNPQIRDVWVPVVVPSSVPAPSRPLTRNSDDQSLERLSRKLHQHYERESDLDDLLKRLREGTVRPDPFRLPRLDALQHDPFSFRGSTLDLLSRLSTGDTSPWAAARRALELSLEELRPRSISPSPTPSALPPPAQLTPSLNSIRERLAYTDLLIQRSFSALTPQELEELRPGLTELAGRFLEWNYLYEDHQKARLDRNLKRLDLLAKVDLAPLLQAAQLLLELGTPEFVAGLRSELQKQGKDLTASIVTEEDTPQGKIRIAGTSDDEHRRMSDESVALLIDLGGNDYYASEIATTTPRMRSSVVIDVQGDDRYESNRDHSIAMGILGVGLLIDLEGNDRYLGMKYSQAVAFSGVGILIDASGQDEYRAQQLAQGASLFGTAILVDGSGNDRYEGRSHAQAVAIGGGTAFLIDQGGDDLYFAKGMSPSGYGTPGTYQGWSQGIGLGLRFLASGGLAVLQDRGGRDRMESGDFGQGAGYYWGLGILDARGQESDTYIGNRYAQAASAHFGMAALLDDGGNDVYDTRGMVAVGIANDHSLSWFRDRAGSDRYPGQHFSGGSSANNSIAIFEDTQGHDTWVGGKQPANGVINDYWGGTSLSLVFQSGHLTPAASSPYDAYDGNSFIFRGGLTPDTLLRTLAPSKLTPIRTGNE